MINKGTINISREPNAPGLSSRDIRLIQDRGGAIAGLEARHSVSDLDDFSDCI
jgi:hypothetical protein